MMKILGIGVMVLMLAGCSKVDEATQQTIDYGTGKTQVDASQRLRKQIKAINEETSRQSKEYGN